MQNFYFLVIISEFIPGGISSVGTSGIIELVKLDQCLGLQKAFLSRRQNCLQPEPYGVCKIFVSMG
jgi:hypothetical protein